MGLNPALGIRIGRLPAGPKNLITDVPGLMVGHHTLAEGHADRRHGPPARSGQLLHA